MDRLLFRDGTVWRHTGTAADHITVLRTADMLYQAKLNRTGYRKKFGHDLRAIQLCWDSGLLNLTHLSDITGVTRLSLRQWVGDDSYARPRGRLNPEHLAVLAQHMEAMTRSHYSMVSHSFLENLALEGTKQVMGRILLGINENREVVISYVSDDVQPRIRPDDPGYLVQGEDGVAAEHPDQADDGHGNGEVESEPDHAGELQGLAPRPAVAESSAAEVSRLIAQHSRVDAAKRREDDGPDFAGQDWHPLEDFQPDKDGDSLLERGKHTPASGLLDDVPIGKPWEQASPES